MSNNDIHNIDPKTIFDAANTPELVQALHNDMQYLLATSDSEAAKGAIKRVGQSYIGIMAGIIILAEQASYKETGEKWLSVPEHRGEWLESVWMNFEHHNRSLIATRAMLDDIFKQ